MIEILDRLFFPVFNILIGIVGILIGLKVYKPFRKEKQEVYYKKFKYFYLIGGVILTVRGFIKVYSLFF